LIEENQAGFLFWINFNSLLKKIRRKRTSRNQFILLVSIRFSSFLRWLSRSRITNFIFDFYYCGKQLVIGNGRPIALQISTDE
jgi:hypothetical protein